MPSVPLHRLARFLTALLLVASVGTVEGCAADPYKPLPPLPNPSQDVLENVANALDILPPVLGEAFKQYLPRARAAMLANDAPLVREIARRIPDDPQVIRGGFAKHFLPLLVAKWARRRKRIERVSALRSLLRHRTIRSGPSPANTAAFDLFEKDLRRQVASLGLRFDHVEHRAYEIGRPVDADFKGKPKLKVGVAMLAHGDVVPADEPGWTDDPFGGVINKDGIFGRGAIDNKGALVAALFALEAVNATGLPTPKPPYLFVGMSGETDHADMKRSIKKRGLPPVVFAVDGRFPVTTSTNGQLMLTLVASATEPSALTDQKRGLVKEEAPDHNAAPAVLLDLSAEAGSGQTPGAAMAFLRPGPGETPGSLIAALHKQNITNVEITADGVTSPQGEVIRVGVKGRTTDLTTPYFGSNAALTLVNLLTNAVTLPQSPCRDLLQILSTRVLQDGNADGFELGGGESFLSATATLADLHTTSSGGCQADLAFAWPAPLRQQDITAAVTDALSEALGPRLRLAFHDVQPAFEAQSNKVLMRQLQQAWQVISGHEEGTSAIPHASYLRDVPGAVAFGPSPPDGWRRPHGPNEFITVDEFETLVEIYTYALMRLCT